MLKQCLEMKARGFCMHVFLVTQNRGDFGRRCAKIVRARRLFPANFAFRCFANNNFKEVKFSAL